MSGDNLEFEWLFDGRGVTAYNSGVLSGRDLELFCKFYNLPNYEKKKDENLRVAIEKAYGLNDPENESMKASERQVGGDHYKRFAIQPAEYCQRNQLPFLESNVVKYVTRHKLKNGKQDIQKAIQCLELILEYEYGTERHRSD